ncbi:hypothetical protein LX32DRAFT_274806 [Colletotrichum zoysiae]|uniref:Uncharacterized protein n=1 Tax=Colletotrichum zoysiae TaxID=1216348 RepID=A0AAD9HNC1_9PEZI|nr:hypothetical protein LX32DRAFT_274806 [Colletotrichum zoysiae]
MRVHLPCPLRPSVGGVKPFKYRIILGSMTSNHHRLPRLLGTARTGSLDLILCRRFLAEPTCSIVYSRRSKSLQPPLLRPRPGTESESLNLRQRGRETWSWSQDPVESRSLFSRLVPFRRDHPYPGATA